MINDFSQTCITKYHQSNCFVKMFCTLCYCLIDYKLHSFTDPIACNSHKEVQCHGMLLI